jgi:diadenosine tetraphosphate (Ap4A) HIT family hydrolase
MKARATGDFELHPQLRADCELLGQFEVCRLLLHRNATLPWFILVPRTLETDFFDLGEDFRRNVLEECARVAAFIRERMAHPKINFASIGNQVPQLHLHVIGRRPGDACWPAPVWGHLEARAHYREAEIDQIRDELVAHYELGTV